MFRNEIIEENREVLRAQTIFHVTKIDKKLFLQNKCQNEYLFRNWPVNLSLKPIGKIIKIFLKNSCP
jgi:hypothetical protein